MLTDPPKSLVLHQFRASHFNEKVRWALDFKGVAHRRISHLPGPHQKAIGKLSGQRSTPVLQADAKVISGSAAIIEFLERQFPQPALYPLQATDRQRALELQRLWDGQMGPATRTLFFATAIQELDYIAALFADGQPKLKQWIYRRMLGFAASKIAEANGASDAARVAASRDVVARQLDWLAENVNASGQLIGASFSVADLTCAALLTPLVDIGHPAMRSPVPVPASIRQLRGQYADHPAIHWVQAQYEAHRGKSAEV
jgi:glutathione S-transferase